MSKVLPVVLLCLFLFSNCKKENLSKKDKTKALASSGKEGEELLLTVESANPHGLFDKYSYIVTDNEGNILGSAKVSDGDKKIEIFGKATKARKINVLEIYEQAGIFSSPTEISVDAFIGVKKGLKWSKPYSTSEFSNHKELSTVSFRNFPQFDLIAYGTGIWGGSLYKESDTTSLLSPWRFYGADSKFLVRLQRGENRFYNFYNIQAGGIVTADLSLCNTPQKFHFIDFPEGFTNVSYSLSGGEAINSQYYGYGLGSNSAPNNKLKTWYSDYPFQNYTIFLFGNKGSKFNLSQKLFYWNWHSGSIPTTFEPLELDIKVQSAKLESFTTDIAGNFKFSQAKFFYNRHSSSDPRVRVDVIGFENLTKIRFPDLSPYLKTAFDFSQVTGDNRLQRM